jgi:hypothetical protein
MFKENKMKKLQKILVLTGVSMFAAACLSGCVVYPEHPAYGYGYGYHHGYWER